MARLDPIAGQMQIQSPHTGPEHQRVIMYMLTARLYAASACSVDSITPADLQSGRTVEPSPVARPRPEPSRYLRHARHGVTGAAVSTSEDPGAHGQPFFVRAVLVEVHVEVISHSQ